MKKYRSQNIDKLKEKAERLYKLDWSFVEIGIVLGRHERTIKRWYDAGSWGGKKRRDDYVAGKGFIERRKKAKVMYLEGDWPKKIASRLDVSLSSIYAWRKLDQWG